MSFLNKSFYIIVEAGVNHDGFLSKAFELVDIAKENHQTSDQVFERIKNIDDIDNMMLHLRCECEEEQNED